MKAWNYIKIDFDQEMGQEYSAIVQVIVKADPLKRDCVTLGQL